MITPANALSALCAAPLIRPENAASNVPGLYLLHDHQGVPRYIGKTKDLRYRVWSNHCVGDENSHKWVAAFNAGRLWHSSWNAMSDQADGRLAKELRAALARRFCKVRTLELPKMQPADLAALETRVRRLAPDPMNDWNDVKDIPAHEPRMLVDQLLCELGWSHAQRAALERQEARFLAWQASLSAKVA